MAASSQMAMGFRLQDETDTKMEEASSQEGLGGAKRSRTHELQDMDAHTERMEARIKELEQKMKEVNFQVGEGEYATSSTRAMMSEIVDLSYRVSHLEHAVYESWELRPSSSYATEAERWKKEWVRLCQEKRGKGDATLGAAKNYVFLGLVNAYLTPDGSTHQGTGSGSVIDREGMRKRKRREHDRPSQDTQSARIRGARTDHGSPESRQGVRQSSCPRHARSTAGSDVCSAGRRRTEAAGPPPRSSQGRGN